MRDTGNVLLPVNLTGDPDVNRAGSAQAMLTNEPERENFKNAAIDLLKTESYKNNT